MKKLDVKSILVGFIIGTITITSVSATTKIIKSANFNDVKIFYNDKEVQLSHPMITVVNEGSQYGSNYMPVRSLLEAMNYEVNWDGTNNAVIIKDITKEGDNIVDDGTHNNIEQNDILIKHSDFLSDYEVRTLESDNIFLWEYYYNGNLNIEDLKEKLKNTTDLELVVGEIFNNLIDGVEAGTMYFYYGKNTRNLLIASQYSEEQNKITYEFFLE